MFIIARYILIRHIFPFFFGFSLIVFVFLTNFLMRDLYKFIGKGLSFFTILEAILLNLAWIVTLAVPMSVLIACIMSFGSLAQDNEITALRASGVSIFSMTRPVLIASIIIGFLTFEFYDKILPESNYRARLLMTDIHKKRPTISIEENIFFDIIPNYRLLIKKVEKKSPWVYDILIFDQTDPDVKRSIVAEKGTLVFSDEKNKLIVTLYNGEIHSVQMQTLENYQRLKFERYVITIDVQGNELERSSSQYRGDREKNIKALKDEVKKLANEINRQKFKIYEALGIKNQAELENFNAIVDSAVKVLKQNMNQQEKSLPGDDNIKRDRLSVIMNRLNLEESILKSKLLYKYSIDIELHKKYSIPAACIVFVLIGVPLGVMTKKGGFAVGGGLSLLLFTIYWAFLIAGESFGDRGMVSPFWAMWTPNFFISLAGIYLLYITSKEMPVLSFAFLKKLIHFKKIL